MYFPKTVGWISELAEISFKTVSWFYQIPYLVPFFASRQIKSFGGEGSASFLLDLSASYWERGGGCSRLSQLLPLLFAQTGQCNRKMSVPRFDARVRVFLFHFPHSHNIVPTKNVSQSLKDMSAKIFLLKQDWKKLFFGNSHFLVYLCK